MPRCITAIGKIFRMNYFRLYAATVAGICAIFAAANVFGDTESRVHKLEFGSPTHLLQAELLRGLTLGKLSTLPLPTRTCVNTTSKARTVAEDTIFYLAAISESGQISANCEKISPVEDICSVAIGQAIENTELVWTRIYRFNRSVKGAINKKTFECFTLP